MARVYLVRHGEAIGYDDSDPGLSELGVTQARIVAGRLDEQPVGLASRAALVVPPSGGLAPPPEGGTTSIDRSRNQQHPDQDHQKNQCGAEDGEPPRMDLPAGHLRFPLRLLVVLDPFFAFLVVMLMVLLVMVHGSLGMAKEPFAGLVGPA